MSRFRLIIHSIVTYPFFDTFIMIIIILSSIALAAEDPVEETSQRNLVLTYFDYLFTCIFAVEMVLKVGVNHLDIDVCTCLHNICTFIYLLNKTLFQMTVSPAAFGILVCKDAMIACSTHF